MGTPIHEPKVVLMTGVSGSIGTHFLAHIMHNTDWKVVGVDSFRHKGYADRLNVLFTDHPDWISRTKIITHDLVAPFSDLTKKKIGHIDYIISMASLSDVFASIVEPVPFVQNNVSLILNLLEYAREIKPEAFVQISTDETYGPVESKESEGFKEWAPILPSNPYAASKACQEAIAISYWRTYNIPLIITNTMNNYGEMQSSAKFPVIVQKKLAKGEKVTIHGDRNNIGSRSYIHSRNFADAVLFLLKNTVPHLYNGGVDRPDRYNIAGDKQMDNEELTKFIAEKMGVEANYDFEDGEKQRPGHDAHYGLDDSKLRDLGWKSPVSFEESMKNVIDWQTEHDEWLC